METMWYVVTPLNTNYRAGDSGGDWTIQPAPEADYYSAFEPAVVAARKFNTGMDRDMEMEHGAFVVSVAWAAA